MNGRIRIGLATAGGGRRRRLSSLALVAGLSATVLLPAAGEGAVTIGSNLGREPNFNQGCSGGCTFRQVSIPTASLAPGGLTSPVNGTIVTWRIRVGGVTDPAALRVIRPLASGLALGAGTSAVVTPPTETTTPYQTNLPVGIGDTIGLDCCDGTGEFFVNLTGDMDRFFGPLGDGESRLPTSDDDNEIAVNADIEPTSAFEVVSMAKRHGGKLRFGVHVPNAGELVADGKRFKATTTTASGPGEITFKVKPTKRTRNRLKDSKKLKAKLTLEFTPTFGTSAAEQSVKAKIRR